MLALNIEKLTDSELGNTSLGVSIPVFEVTSSSQALGNVQLVLRYLKLTVSMFIPLVEYYQHRSDIAKKMRRKKIEQSRMQMTGASCTFDFKLSFAERFCITGSMRHLFATILKINTFSFSHLHSVAV